MYMSLVWVRSIDILSHKRTMHKSWMFIEMTIQRNSRSQTTTASKDLRTSRKRNVRVSKTFRYYTPENMPDSLGCRTAVWVIMYTLVCVG